MNQDNKISSVRPGTINIELDLDLYVLLYYRGLRSVDDIYRLQSAHTENNRKPCVHCNKKNYINSIKLCLSFSQGLKIHVLYFFKCSSFWGTASPRPPAGASPLDPTGGLPSPDPLICPPTPPFRSAPVRSSPGRDSNLQPPDCKSGTLPYSH